jgi:uncharacterized protein (TIGR00369 family)
MEYVKSWVEKSPYGLALGVALSEISEEAARLTLPYKDENSNPGRVLHGGVAASLSVISAQAVARAALGPESGPWHTVGFQINYLAAAMGETVVAEATLDRRGKELCFVNVLVRTEAESKPIARANVAVRGRFGAEACDRYQAAGDAGGGDPGPMGRHIGGVPFIGNRGISAENMTDGHSRLVMPWLDANGDESGGLHEGAVLALLDTAGAMAAWAETGPGRFKASTPSIQAQVLGSPPRDDLVAYGRVVQRDNEIFWCDVEVAGQSDQLVCARGTVIYRIIT